MTKISPMVPSAKERAIQINTLPDHNFMQEIIRQIDAAYRDGFTAGVHAERQATDRDQINHDEGRRFERAAIIAMLREPRESLLECDEFTRIVLDCARAIHSSEIPYGRILRALADHLESQPQNGDDN